MGLLIIAYVLLGIGVIVKAIALYVLAGKKDLPFEVRRKKYSKINWLSYGILIIGVAIIVYKQWL